MQILNPVKENCLYVEKNVVFLNTNQLLIYEASRPITTQSQAQIILVD